MLEHIVEGYLKVKVKPGMPRTEIIGWDSSIMALRVSLHAKAEDNRANIELLKLVRKLTKKKAEIVSGARSREKLLRIG